MAWSCSGESNAELVAKLQAAGIVTSPEVRDAMLATDRAHFCPREEEDGARAGAAAAPMARPKKKKKNSTYQYGPYADAPQALGFKVTISAPHIHATALEALRSHVVAGSPQCPESSPESLAERRASGTQRPRRVLDVGSGSGVLVL